MEETRIAHPRSYLPRNWLDMPTIGVAVCWLAIWLLWPAGIGRPGARPAGRPAEVWSLQAAPETARIVDPLRFVTRPYHELSAAVKLGRDTFRFDYPPSVEPKLLQKPRSWSGASLPLLPGRERTFLNGDYYPVSRGQTADGQPAAAPQALWTWMDNALKERGLIVPALPEEIMKDTPWQVTALVELASDGRADHVLITAGSGRVETDALLARVLHRARANPADRRSLGRVVIGYSPSPDRQSPE